MTTVSEVFSKATYSPEDNKLRLYPTNFDEYLPEDVYKKLSEVGFRKAYKQELYVSPSWSVSREDVCLEFVDEITCEETSIGERAVNKAERLEVLAQKRLLESNVYSQAASSIMDNALNQPILAGHHSQRKLEKAQEKLERDQDKAESLLSTANYWLYRATGVERHANKKHDPFVRIGRIKTLKKELRDVQRSLNHAHIVKKLWSKIQAETDEVKKEKYVSYYLGTHLATGATAPMSTYSAYSKEEITSIEAIELALNEAKRVINSVTNARVINHVLNRLAYERYELGQVKRYTVKLTATIIKAFARENGVHKPDCVRVDECWELSSSVQLPLHLSSNCLTWLSMKDDDWADLFESVGYEVPAAKAKAVPILNFKANQIQVVLHNRKQWLSQIELTKSQYTDIYSDYRGCKSSACGDFRVKICKNPDDKSEWYSKQWVCVLITDSKVHTNPLTASVNMTESEAA